MKPVVIIGASKFGELVSMLVEEAGRRVAGFADDFQQGKAILCSTRDLGTRVSPDDADLVMAIGYRHLDARLAMFRELRSKGFKFPSLVHPAARVSPRAEIGDGSLIMASVDIDAFTVIEELCVLWPNATVSHDSRIGEGTFVSPAATLCGFVEVGPLSFIGANSTVVDGSALPARSFVKAATRHHNSQART